MATPEKIYLGATAKWTVSISSYPASDGYSASYLLYNDQTTLTITTTGSGSVFTANHAPSVTTDWTPGQYRYQLFATKSGEKWLIDQGDIELVADVSIEDHLDGRSHVKKVLDALESLILGKAGADVSSYSIANRTLTRMTPEELITWHDKYKQMYKDEQAAENLARGGGNSGIVRVRFTGD